MHVWLQATGPGIGDALFLSAVAHEMQRQAPGFVGIVCAYPDLYLHNPSVQKCVHLGRRIGPVVEFDELHNQELIKEHNVQFMCRKLGLRPTPIEQIRQYIYLTDAEHVDLDERYITIHAGTGAWTPNKYWYLDRFSALIAQIKHQTPLRVFQVGGRDEPPLPGCDRYLLGEPLRATAGYIQGAVRHICTVTGTMHIASGVGTKSIVLFGGREDPRVTGYVANDNITFSPPQKCDPCWLVRPCPYGHWQGTELHKPCMDGIEVASVMECLLRALHLR